MTDYKVKQVLYGVAVDDITGACKTEEHVISSIRHDKAIAICKNRFTWVKRSTKNGDWGWAKYIPEYYKTKWNINAELTTLATTKLGAWQKINTIAANRKLTGRFWDKEISDKVLHTSKITIAKLSANSTAADNT